MDISSVLPFLAMLKKQVPDASPGYVQDRQDSVLAGPTGDGGLHLAGGPPVDISDNLNAPSKIPTNPQMLPEPMGPPAPPPQQSAQPDMSIGAGQQPGIGDIAGAAPTGKAAAPKLSKGTQLMMMLKGGLMGGLAGMAQNAETYAQTGRNAGFGGGFFGAQQLPFLRAMQGAQYQDVMSQVAQRNAQTQMLGQSIPITMPNGQQVFVPATQAGRPLASAISGGYGITKATMDNQTKMAVAELQSGRLGHLVAGVNPDTGQPGMQMLDKQGNSIGWIDHSVVPSLMARTSSTVEYKEDAQGNLHVLPKTTVSRPNIPGQGAAPALPQMLRGATQPGGAAQQPGVPAQPQGGAGGIVPGFQGKAGAEQGVAYNPQTNERSWMTRGEAAQQGFDFAAGGRNAAKTMEDDRVLNVRLGDIEQKTALYGETMKTPLSIKDTADLNVALAAANKALLTPGLLAKLPGNEGAANVLNEVAKNYNLNDMSAGTYKRLQAYVNMREAMLGYTAALTKSGKSSDKNLELNLDVVPTPVMEPSKAAEGLDQFRQNLDIVEQGVPRVKGVKSPKEWRGGQQGGGQSGVPTGARVRDYTALQPGQPQPQPTPGPR